MLQSRMPVCLLIALSAPCLACDPRYKVASAAPHSGAYPLPRPPHEPPRSSTPQAEPAAESAAPFDTKALFSVLVSVRTALPHATGRCLGAMIAPRYALTAAHCVHGNAPMSVAPASSPNAKRIEVRRHWLDPDRKETRYVDKETIDIAVLELATPLALDSYAHYAREPARPGSPAVSMHDTPTEIVAMGFRLFPNRRAPLYYASVPYAQAGDSGAPVFAQLGGRSVIAAVLAGGNDDSEALARVDVLSAQLDSLLASTPKEPPAKVVGSVKK